MTAKTLSSFTQRLARTGNIITAVILVLLPFHAWFTTWLGTTVIDLDLIRVWKELLIFGLSMLALGVIASDKTRRWRMLDRQKLIRWVGVYIVFVMVMTLITVWHERVSVEAILYGLIIQLRFFALFAIMAVFSLYDDFIVRYWRQLLLIPAAIVVLFGLLQVFVLPHDFLTFFGYGPDTIPAYQTVDQKLAFQRIQSTLRGANPLGAYLVVVLTGCMTLIIRKHATVAVKVLAAAGVLALFFTYSRSAWIGLIIAIVTLVILAKPRFVTRQNVLIAVAALVIMLGTVWWQRDNDFLQNTLFHADESSQSITSSNEQRSSAISRSFEDLATQPLGGGVGSAGPASQRNELSKPRIAENYFIQTGQELGWIGLGLFLWVMLLGWRWLLRERENDLALLLCATLPGIVFINLVSHAWADDTLSLVWWGLFGAIFGYGILNKVQTKAKHETTKTPRI